MNVADLVRRNARCYPDNEALVVPDERSDTWRELDQRTNRMANALLALGLDKGDRLGVISPNAGEFIDMFFACAKSGVAGAATNIRQSDGELIGYLRLADPGALLVHASQADRAKEIVAAVPGIRAVIGFGRDHGLDLDLEELIGRASPQDPHAPVGPDDLYQLSTTSGTTGAAKAVMLSHRNAVSAMWAYLADYSAREDGDTWLQVNPLYLNAGGPAHLGHVLWKGGRTVVIPGGFAPVTFLESIQRFRVTHTSLVPTMVRIVLDEVPGLASYDLSSLRSVVLGGSPMTAAFLDEACAVFGDVFDSTYGMAETYSTGLILRRESRTNPDGSFLPGRLASAGRPHVHLDIRIVLPDTFVDAPADASTIGEIWVRGASVSPGYFRMPEETAASRVDGWFRTGDLATWSQDGFVTIVDRLKDIIITGGLNVPGSEIEHALMTHPDVADVAAVGIPHPRWGEAIHAAVVLRSGADLTEAELAAFVGPLLASYKRPKSIAFVAELPRNSTGKVLKRHLRSRFAGWWNGPSADRPGSAGAG